MIDFILRLLFLILFLIICDLLYVSLGFIFYYIFKFKKLGHILVAFGFAGLFHRPKWLMYNCPLPDCQHCKLWTCPRFKNYD